MKKNPAYPIMSVSTSRTLERQGEWAAESEITAVRPAYFIWIAISILLAGFALRIWDLGLSSLWSDEIMSEYRAQAPLLDSLENILKTIDQTPFYFLLLRAFPTGDELLLRLPSALLGILGTSLVMFVTRRLYRNSAMGLWAGAWLAFNPYHVFLSRMARHYSLIFVLSLVVSYLFLSLWQGRPNRGRWISFVLLSALAYLTHYSLLALPFTQFILLALVWRRRIAFARRWFTAQIIAATPAIVWALTMLVNLTPREPQWGPHPWFGDIALTFRNMTVGHDGTSAWYAIPGLLVALSGLALTIQVWRRQPPAVRDINLYWAILLTGPFALVFLVSLGFVNMYMDRYFMALSPGLVFLIAYGWSCVNRSWWTTAILGVILTGSITVGLALYHHTLQREDWSGVANYIEHEYQPGDIFVVDRAVTMTAFDRYFEPDEPLHVIQLSETSVAIPPDEPNARYWVIYQDPNEDIHRLGVMPGFNPLKPNRSVTSQWLIPRKGYVVDQKVFDGITILLLETHTVPTVALAP